MPPPAAPGVEGTPGAPSDVPSDGALVARTLAGRSEAFGALYERHVDRVYRYARFRVRDPAVAADLTQDVFVGALRALPQLRDPERFVAWLLQIAHHRVVNFWVAEARRGDRSARVEGPEDVEGSNDDEVEIADPAVEDDLLAAIERRRRMASVIAAAAELTADQQAVLGLRFAAGLSVREAAGVVGRSEAAVRQLQQRALARLRRLVAAREAGS